MHVSLKRNNLLNRNKPNVEFGGNKIKRCVKKTKHAKISKKETFLTHTRTYQGVRNVPFSENLACFVF